MPVAEGVHFGGAAGFAAGFDDAGDLVVDFEDAHGAAGAAAAAEFLAAGADGGEVGAGAGAVFEEHGLAVGQAHDVFHVVGDGLDEAGAALGIFVLGGGAGGLFLVAIVVPVAEAGVFADAVLVVEADVEPDGGVEGAELVDAEPSQFVIEHFAVGFGEITVGDAPVGDGAGDAVDELADGEFAFGGFLFAVEVFGDDDFGGELGPGLGDFDVFLLEDDFAGVIGDFGGAAVPFELVEGFDLGVAEHAFEAERFAGGGLAGFYGASGGDFGGPAAGGFGSRRHCFLTCINHGGT